MWKNWKLSRNLQNTSKVDVTNWKTSHNSIFPFALSAHIFSLYFTTQKVHLISIEIELSSLSFSSSFLNPTSTFSSRNFINSFHTFSFILLLMLSNMILRRTWKHSWQHDDDHDDAMAISSELSLRENYYFNKLPLSQLYQYYLFHQIKRIYILRFPTHILSSSNNNNFSYPSSR